MHFFTSITANYLPKARVLAGSIKRLDPEARFHLMLCDDYPRQAEADSEPFDTVLTLDDLPIDQKAAWIFRHAVVELCTAVKGLAFLEIARRFDADKIVYFDPDIAVFSGLDRLEAELDRASILLTPHQTLPEQTLEAVVDNEICILQHGVFNLGFLGVRTSEEGRRFLDWWSQRLLAFCHDDIPRGLFTDQRWIDLVPAFFEDIRILREPRYNVATWNLTHRVARGSMDQGITINGEPLAFYHFSGFDSGAQEAMLKKYGRASPVLTELRSWYVEACRRAGQDALGRLPCKYATFDDGEPIHREQRLLYRVREDLQRAFPDPFITEPTERSYRHWYRHNGAVESGAAGGGPDSPELLRSRLVEAYRELDLIKRSRSWRVARMLSQALRPFR